jgi:hypothetical protein
MYKRDVPRGAREVTRNSKRLVTIAYVVGAAWRDSILGSQANRLGYLYIRKTQTK